MLPPVARSNASNFHIYRIPSSKEQEKIFEDLGFMGSKKMIKDLKRGDQVYSLSNPYNSNSDINTVKVTCLLQTNIINGETHIVSLDGGLKITPWHPVIYENNWCFPHDIRGSQLEPCSAVYTVVLNNDHTIMINNMWCITLGHGYTVGVLDHPYFGTSDVINDLRKMPGWDKGHIIINNNNILRNSQTSDVVKITLDIETYNKVRVDSEDFDSDDIDDCELDCPIPNIDGLNCDDNATVNAQS